MPIHFACEKCGHPFEVDDRHAGHLGRCKHCGHVNMIPGSARPAGAESPAGGGLKMRPIEEETTGDPANAHPVAGLKVRPVHAGDEAASRGLDPEEPETKRASARGWFGSKRKEPSGPYVVLDPDRREDAQARAFHLNPHYETRLARMASRTLRGDSRRTGSTSSSLCFLGLAGYAFVSSNRPLLPHAGAVGVIACNVGMLVAGVFYLITIPFKHSLPHGVGTLLLPPYAVYYWVTHWPQMRKPVINTLRGFTPIALVGLAYLLYVEAPAIEEGAKTVERIVDTKGKAIEGLVAPEEKAQPEAPSAVEKAPEPRPQQSRKKARGTF